MVLSITGMSSSLALTLLDATESQVKTQIQNDPATARAIANFQKEAGSITSAKDFVNNYDVYSFVMGAFGLQDLMFGKAMVQQILESDSTQPGSLVNQMADSRITDLYNTLGFTGGGTANANLSSADWQNAMIQRYVDQQYISGEADQNATVGTALTFRQEAPNVQTWYDILKNQDMTTFMYTVLGMPQSMASMDLTQQVAILSKKFDITTLQDPTVVSNLVKKYAIMSDAQNAAANAANNPAVVMMNSAASASQNGKFVPATLDITSINFSALSASNLYG